MTNKTCYIGIVGPEKDYSRAWRSIIELQRREGDAMPAFYMGTKGYELRQLHINNFLKSDYDMLFMLDHDQVVPGDTLEKLRAHDLPLVSGLYMRRQYDPIAPIWFEDNPDDEWPMRPWTRVPEPGRLHKIAASGWGCILIHREVILNTQAILKGEQLVIEDDLDIWPYDLPKVLRALYHLRLLAELRPSNHERTLSAIESISKRLSAEIRPLRGTKDSIGSDIRFGFFAKHAGYQMWGDPDAEVGHMINYPLAPSDFAGLPEETLVEFDKANGERVQEARDKWRRHVDQLRGDEI